MATKSAPKAKPAKPSKAPKTTKPSKSSAPAKAAGGKKGPMFQKVAFTLFSVGDPVRARAFYEDTLGLKRGMASPEGTWTEYDLPGGGCLALFRHPNQDLARPAGGAAIALEVADLDALDERLKAAGVTYLGDRVHGPHCRMSNIEDSEGNTIILHQLNKH
jgi:predicted enzyme related to lactoylglutathione lyase